MATGPRYAVRFRRKRESRTNYRKRLAMLKSGSLRLVVRRTNTRLICQVVEYLENGDKIWAHADSGHLREFGWKHGLKNMAAAYLLGLYVGRLASTKKVRTAVLDLGLQSKKSSRLFAVLKGAIDGGLEVKHGELKLAVGERLQGKHLGDKVAKDFEVVKDNIIKGEKVENVKQGKKSVNGKKVEKKTSTKKKASKVGK